jgi:lysophospholipase L1-like esterase
MKSIFPALVAGMMLVRCVIAAEPAPTIESVRQRLESGEPTRIVCFGDSITGAYYHTGGQRAWCDMLGIALQRTFPNANVTMFNAGISGQTTAQGLTRIEKDVLEKRPHLVVVMFGMNDVARLPLNEFGSNLKTIAQKSLDAGSAVVLCTPNFVHENPTRPNSKLAELSEVTRQVAKEMALPVSDCFADYRTRREQDETAWMLLMSDEIHPNMHGHQRMAELIAETVSRQRVELDNVPPLADSLHHTLERLEAGETIHLVAMPPYDQWMAAALLAAGQPEFVNSNPTWWSLPSRPQSRRRTRRALSGTTNGF